MSELHERTTWRLAIAGLRLGACNSQQYMNLKTNNKNSHHKTIITLQLLEWP